MKKTLVRILSTALAGLLLLTGCFRKKANADNASMEGMTAGEIISMKHPTEPDMVVDGVGYVRREDLTTLLLMGIDKSGDLETTRKDQGGQCDVLLLLVLDGKNRTQTILQLDRDTMTEVEILDLRGKSTGITRVQPICISHAYGPGDEKSCENTVRAVSRLLLDIPIDGYAAILYEAIPDLNDTVGGIEVTIEDDFSASDPSLVKGETLTLKGKQALTYVRGRMTVADGTNTNRMKRQRNYLNTFGKKVRSMVLTNSSVINDLVAAAEPYLTTDMTLSQLSSAALEGAGYADGGILTTSGEHTQTVNPNGTCATEFYADEESILQNVLTLFYEPLG